MPANEPREHWRQPARHYILKPFATVDGARCMADDLAKRAAEAVAGIPHCAHLGMSIESVGERFVTARLPWRDDIVGNPATGVIAGGAITTLMDTVCGLSTMCVLEQPEATPTMDLRIDYMQPAQPGEPVFGRAEIYRMSRHILFARGIAYQSDGSGGQTVVAHCVATFMRTGRKPEDVRHG